MRLAPSTMQAPRVRIVFGVRRVTFVSSRRWWIRQRQRFETRAVDVDTIFEQI